jgi:hypothetical protein
VPKWRYRCPRGHTTVEPTNEHWWCRSCARNWSIDDPEFDYVIDAKTGDRLRREELRDVIRR